MVVELSKKEMRKKENLLKSRRKNSGRNKGTNNNVESVLNRLYFYTRINSNYIEQWQNYLQKFYISAKIIMRHLNYKE